MKPVLRKASFRSEREYYALKEAYKIKKWSLIGEFDNYFIFELTPKDEYDKETCRVNVDAVARLLMKMFESSDKYSDIAMRKKTARKKTTSEQKYTKKTYKDEEELEPFFSPRRRRKMVDRAGEDLWELLMTFAKSAGTLAVTLAAKKYFNGK